MEKYRRVGIIGAMDKEIEGFKASMQIAESKKIAQTEFFVGRLGAREAVLVRSGIGKVNAAVATDILIREFKVEAIIFTGIAGAIAPSLNVGDVVIATHLVQHDFDTTAFGDKLGDVPGSQQGKFFADAELVTSAQKAAQSVLGAQRVFTGVIVTGDQFIADKKKTATFAQNFEAMAVEMEGAAVAHVATLYGIPFVVIRAMSDKADGSAHVSYTEFSVQAANNSIKIVQAMLHS